MYDMSDLFKKHIDNEEIKIYHPTILVCINWLEKIRKNVNNVPDSVIHIKLPIKVESSSWMESF